MATRYAKLTRPRTDGLLPRERLFALLDEARKTPGDLGRGTSRRREDLAQRDLPSCAWGSGPVVPARRRGQ